MAFVNWLNSDVFSVYRDKINSAFTSLKAGAANQVLVGTTAGSDPGYKDVWGPWTTVSSSQGFNSVRFNLDSNVNDRLRFRISTILNLIQISGSIQTKDNTFGPGVFYEVFTLPTAPTKFWFGPCGKEGPGTNADPFCHLNIEPDGKVYIRQLTSGTAGFTGEHYYLNAIFSIS